MLLHARDRPSRRDDASAAGPAGRAQLSVLPEHGPGAAVRNVRKRFGTAAPDKADFPPLGTAERDVEVRDLAIYEALLQTPAEPLREAA